VFNSGSGRGEPCDQKVAQTRTPPAWRELGSSGTLVESMLQSSLRDMPLLLPLLLPLWWHQGQIRNPSKVQKKNSPNMGMLANRVPGAATGGDPRMRNPRFGETACMGMGKGGGSVARQSTSEVASTTSGLMLEPNSREARPPANPGRSPTRHCTPVWGIAHPCYQNPW
jgi:hypothetical protein